VDRIERMRGAGLRVLASVGRSAGVSGMRRPAGIAAVVAIGLAGLVIAGAAVAAGCGGRQISLTSKDNLATIDVSKGDTIVLKLDENPSTGYHWEMEFSGGLKVTSNEYKQRSGTQNLVGAGGTHTWTIDVTESGTQAIIGMYLAPVVRPGLLGADFRVVIRVD
jgi:predicted secreted protein